MQVLAQFLLSVAMYSIMGATVGLGITVARKCPQVSEFFRQRPVLGWTLAFAVGDVVVIVVLTVVQYAASWLLAL